MGRKSKFTAEQKEQAVLDYKSGKKKIPELCKELGVHKSGKCIYHWISQYEDKGRDVFFHKEKNRKYDAKLKEAAIQDYLDGFKSFGTIARLYNVSSPSIVENWIKKHIEEHDVNRIVDEKVLRKDKKIKMLQQKNRELERKLLVKEKEIILLKKFEGLRKEENNKDRNKAKYKVIKQQNEKYNWSINWMCDVLGVNRGGYYKWMNRM